MKWNITFEWYTDDLDGDVPERHIPELEKNALDQIVELSEQSFIHGQLHHETEDGIHYYGTWDYKRERPEDSDSEERSIDIRCKI